MTQPQLTLLFIFGHSSHVDLPFMLAFTFFSPPKREQTIIFCPFHDAVLTVSLYKSAARAHASFWNLVGGMSLGSIFFAVMLA